MIDFRMDTFIAVCRYMNYTRAAEALHITQPAVTQHIQYLENAYQTKLFHYNKKKISLTDTGQMLLDAAITMKHDELYLKKAILQKQQSRMQLNFGVSLTVGEYLIPKKVAAYARAHTDTPIRMLVDSTKELLEALNHSEIDFAIVEGNFPKNEYDSEIFGKEELIAVCKEACPDFREPVSLTELLKETIVVREMRSGGREILERSLEGKNLALSDFRNVMEASNIQAIKTFVEEGCGIAFLYASAAEQEIAEGKLRRIKLKDFQLWHDIMFIWRKGSIFATRYLELYHMLKRGESETGVL